MANLEKQQVSKARGDQEMAGKKLGWFSGGIASLVLASVAGGASAQSGDEVASRKVSKETIGAWAVQCSEVSGQEKQCNLSQTLINNRKRQRVASWIIGKNGEGVLMSSVTVPAGVDVSSGVSIQIGDADSFQVPFKTCVKTGCVAQFKASSAVVNAMSRYKKAVVTVQTLQKKGINLTFSLSGFTRAYETYQGEQS
jgi:invasion protein IalB